MTWCRSRNFHLPCWSCGGAVCRTTVSNEAGGPVLRRIHPPSPPPPPRKKERGKVEQLNVGGEGREDKSSSRSSVRRQLRLPCREVLYCAVLYFTVPYFTVLYFTVLYCTGLYCVGRGDSPNSVTLVATIVLLNASRLPRALCVCIYRTSVSGCCVSQFIHALVAAASVSL